MKKIEPNQDIYQIKVTLRGSKPPIWRRLEVPSKMKLSKFHDVLQAAMEWNDYHLYGFRVGNTQWEIPGEMDFGGPPAKDSRKAALSTMFGGLGGRAVYTYDFGDDWEHDLVVEKVFPPVPDQLYPLCTAGKRKAPPEDCGGMFGFYEMLEALKDPKHENHTTMKEWIGGFAPDDFAIDEVNDNLQPLRKRCA